MRQTLENIVDNARAITQQGRVASYIPKLAEANAGQLGAYIMDITGQGYGAGDWEKKVTIQSIAKVAVFLQALADCPLEKLSEKISLNATAESFNSIVDLEEKNMHKPLNPYINSGAIASLGLLRGSSEERFDSVHGLLCALTGGDELDVDMEVYRSEKATGDRNRAIAYFMKSTGIIEGDVEGLLDTYFRICSIKVNCKQLATFAATLANGGKNPVTNVRAATVKNSQTALAVMVSCGMYAQSGEFLVRAGIPAKSGVGGGIMAAVPRNCGVGVIGPALNETGNSIGGIEILAALSDALGLSIF